MNNIDWTGNKTSVHAQNSSSNIFDTEREKNDFYATPPRAAEDLLRNYPSINNIWECAAGQGHLAEVFKAQGKLGRATELYERGYGETGVDFLKQTESWNGWIVTNPPFKFAKEFAMKANELASVGVALFLKIQFLESVKRRELFEKYPPRYVYVYTKRCPQCALGGDFSKPTGNAVCYAWFVWEKGFLGEPVVRWIN